ncbi:MAG: response regulator [Nitrospiraceae bacterium]
MTLHLHDSTNERLGRVLVVDDEESIRRIAVRSLTRSGFEVVEAENGERAIAALNAGDNPLMVDAILCDIAMPKINGHEAIAYFLAQYPGVPIVVLTGYPEVDWAVSLMRAGVMDYLVKPISKDDLVTVVAKAVQSHEILKDQFVV